MRRAASLVLGVIVGSIATACLGGHLVASSRGTTRIESVPTGALVLVMGEPIGITPLEVEDRLIFPVSYPRDRAALYGRVVLQRAGCATVDRAVDLRASNEGLMIELSCAQGEEEAGVAPR